MTSSSAGPQTNQRPSPSMYVMVSSTVSWPSTASWPGRLSTASQSKALTQELTPGTPRTSLETSLEWVRMSSLIVFLLGPSYGSLVPGRDISYCEAEWDEARRLKRKCLVFIVDEAVHPVSPDLLKAYVMARRR